MTFGAVLGPPNDVWTPVLIDSGRVQGPFRAATKKRANGRPFPDRFLTVRFPPVPLEIPTKVQPSVIIHGGALAVVKAAMRVNEELP